MTISQLPFHTVIYGCGTGASSASRTVPNPTQQKSWKIKAANLRQLLQLWESDHQTICHQHQKIHCACKQGWSVSKLLFFLSLFFSSFVVHAACDRHQLWRSNQCFICLHLYICSQRSPLILKVQHLLKTGNWFYTVIPTTNPYWSELSPSNTECLYLLVGLLILLSKIFGLGVTQTPSTGLRHPSFNHCHI